MKAPAPISPRSSEGYREGSHVYVCGPDRYMQAVLEVAEQQGFPEEARHLEYFSVPEVPDYENHPFTLRLRKSGQRRPLCQQIEQLLMF